MRITAEHWLDAARHCPSPYFNARPNGEMSLTVIHNISLPPGQFGGPYIEQLFLGQLAPDVHPYFAEIYQLEVSAHLLIRRDGEVVQFVAFDQRAWHAGGGRWRGINDLNSVSLGIELDNVGTEDFAPAQMAALKKLLDDLCTRHAIPRDAVIAHGDMAPTRKRDPSARFPWQELWQAGFGVWYAADLPEPPPEFDAVLALQTFGYDTRDLPAAVKAFSRRFRGEEHEVLDAADRRILYDLITP